MNYDTMSVDALLAEYVHAQWVGFYTGVESEISIKSALRKAAIREASVGVVRLRMDDGDSCWRGFKGVNDEEDLPDGDYVIVPRETP